MCELSELDLIETVLPLCVRNVIAAWNTLVELSTVCAARHVHRAADVEWDLHGDLNPIYNP